MVQKRNVFISCRRGSGIVDPRTIGRRAERLLRFLELDGSTLSILLCDDEVIRKLNREYRQKDEATDVLSFSMSEGEVLVGDSELLGDIIISVETAVRQAPAVGHSATEEVTSLLIHGLLHLLGYSHSNRTAEKKMQQKARILAREIAYHSHASSQS